MRNARDVVRGSQPAENEGADPDAPRTYRGSDLDELLPRIREELGPDAIVVRQREGLDGGFGGFFQKRCVEVVARRATPGLDAYDAAAPQPAGREAAAEPPAPAIAEIMRVASPFIEQLRAAEVAVAGAAVAEHEQADEEQRVTGAFGTTAYAMSAGGGATVAAATVDELPDPPAPPLQLVPDEEPGVEGVGPFAASGFERPHDASDDADLAGVREPAARTGAAATHERALVAAGIAPALAAELVGATISHVLPFAPRRTLKRALREALARRIPVAPPVAAGGRAIAFVGAGGSGKTLCAARLAAAYAQHSDLAVTVMTLTGPQHGGSLRELLEPVAVDVLDARSADARVVPAVAGTVTVVDTSAVSPASATAVRKLATKLKRLGAPEVHVAVPATLSSGAVRTLLDGFAPLRPAAIVLTHLDEVGHPGPVVDEAIARGIAISYTSDGSAPDGFAPADPAALAARVLA
ncbi:MAG: hypothetical protein ACLGI5_08400 [Thermoleophilia bacterium]